jgi:outer membrane protein assembly factor BamA
MRHFWLERGWWLGALALSAPFMAAADAPPVMPPMEFFSRKVPLPELLLNDKREGRYFTGFPALGFDDATKFNYGVALQFYDNGRRDSPFFRYTPYRRKLAIQAIDTTGGFRTLLVDYDEPYVADTPWRLSAHVNLTNNEREKYFGVGDAAQGGLTFPGSNQVFRDFNDYRDALETQVNGKDFSHYAEYHRTVYASNVNVAYDLLGGRLRPLLGLEARYVQVADYTGRLTNGLAGEPTHLQVDAQAGEVVGLHGGWDNAFRGSVTYDTRDFEPNPQSGVTVELAGRYVSDLLGSEFHYLQTTASARYYRALRPDPHPLIVAGRLLYSAQFGTVPVYSLAVLPTSEGDALGFGGFPTLRGYPDNRFIGKSGMVANAELRWTFSEKVLWRQHLDLMLVPFIDVGRSFDEPSDTTLSGWKLSGGGGFRVAWNLATLISFDIGVSGEGNFFSMAIGTQF